MQFHHIKPDDDHNGLVKDIERINRFIAVRKESVISVKVPGRITKKSHYPRPYVEGFDKASMTYQNGKSPNTNQISMRMVNSARPFTKNNLLLSKAVFQKVSFDDINVKP